MQREVQACTPHQAIDILGLMSESAIEEQSGAWLALGTGDLAALFHEGWSIEEVLEALRIVLKGVQALSKFSRRHLFELGAAAIIGSVFVPEGKRISAEDRA